MKAAQLTLAFALACRRNYESVCQNAGLMRDVILNMYDSRSTPFAALVNGGVDDLRRAMSKVELDISMWPCATMS